MYNEIALFLNAILLGTMVSFIVVTSPAVFKTLDKEYSQKFLRYIFPRLFNFCFLISALTILLFALGDFLYGTIVSIVIATSFLFNTYVLTPRINIVRDLSLTGDKASEKLFKNLHLTSVVLYLINIFLAVSVFIPFYT
jgi:hypothetical protein|tara:strand:+ start:114 stop:530 length:417 start_codon:yes stop_codon:yes gene_type:complete